MKQYFLIVVTFCLVCLTQLTIAQGIIKDDFLVNDDSGNEHQLDPSISMDPAGSFVITWQDYRNGNGDIYFQRYNSSGAALGVNIKVNTDTSNANQDYPSISMDGAGNFVVAWDDTRNNNYDVDIYFQRYTSTGAALGVNTRVNDDIDSVKQWYPSSAMDATGNFVIVWIDERNGNLDVYYQRFTSTGTPLGANTKVNDDTTITIQTNPSIAMDATGNYIIAWHDYRNSNADIYFQIYTSNGTPLGANTKVNDDVGIEFQHNPSISMDAVGTFVIAWQDFRNSNWDIFFQRYTNTGTTLGMNTRANDDAGSEYQRLPRISVNDVGDFVIVWDDERFTGSDIFGQRYFSSGSPNGGNYRIVAEDLGIGAVVFASNQVLVFSWVDDRRSQGYDIYAKIVNWNWNGVTAIIDDVNINPIDFSLSQNYPNPFNPSTNIKFTISDFGFVNLKVYDLLGNEVTTLVNEEKPAGEFEVEFNVGRDSSPDIASGIYFYQLRAGKYIETKKMLLIK